MRLRPSPAGACVVACNSCRASADARDDAEGRRGGARLAGILRQLAASDPAYVGVAVDEMPCLFACTDHCTVHLRAPGRVGYVLGRFRPDEAAARAILDYAARYAASETGAVPYADWPEGVRGHFIVRTPPPGLVVA